MPRLDAERRKGLKASDYACPKDRKLPINDADHVRNAMARFNQVESNICHPGLAERRILAAAKRFGVDVEDFAKARSFKR